MDIRIGDRVYCKSLGYTFRVKDIFLDVVEKVPWAEGGGESIVTSFLEDEFGNLVKYNPEDIYLLSSPDGRFRARDWQISSYLCPRWKQCRCDLRCNQAREI